MKETLFFENINILYGDKSEVTKDSILIVNGKIKAFGSTAFTKIDPAFEPPCEVKYIKFPNGRFAEAISRRFHHHFLL